MRLDSVRELKAALRKSLVAPLTQTAAMRRSLAVAAGPVDATHRTVALGIAPKAPGDYRLAVRVQRPELTSSSVVDAITSHAKGEVDVRYIGRVVKRARRATAAATTPWYQKKCRPLRIGCSVGHYKITAGTLGCFVTRRSDGARLILSNNHVLANENAGKAGDDIVQPGEYDGGKRPGDVIGKLDAFVKLKTVAPNAVDCAVADIKTTIKYEYREISEIGELAGLGGAVLDVGGKVSKTGRTTGPTRGTITAFELDNVVVGYDLGDLTFDGQIEVEGAGSAAFSAGGDSGSLIVDQDLNAIALLFAGGDQGGANGKGLSYANPIPSVLDALKVNLLY